MLGHDPGGLTDAVSGIGEQFGLELDLDTETLFRLGFAQQQGEQLADAVDTYRAALDENPDLIAARLNLSTCLRELGDL